MLRHRASPPTGAGAARSFRAPSGSSLGCTITGATYLLASPGEEYVIAYGAVLAGLLALGRGLMIWHSASQPFPWMAVFLATAAPPAVVSAVAGGVSWHQHAQRETRRAEEARRLDEARAVEEEARAALQRKAADEERARSHTARVNRALEQLSSPRSMTRCEAALDLGHAKAREAMDELLSGPPAQNGGPERSELRGRRTGRAGRDPAGTGLLPGVRPGLDQ